MISQPLSKKLKDQVSIMIALVRSMGMHEALIWVYMQTTLLCALINICTIVPRSA